MGLFDWLLGKEKAESGGGVLFPDPVEKARFVVVDTELTGLDPRKDDIVSIGAMRMTGGRIALGDVFYHLVCPRADLESKSVVVHGITPAQLDGKPYIDTVLKEFVRYGGSDIIVGHCLSIDLSFLNRESRRIFGTPLHNPVVDTLSLYGWLRSRRAEHPVFSIPLNGNIRLYDMAKAFGIAVDKAHDALGDAFVTAQLFQRFLPILDGFGIRETEDLLRIGDPGRQGENILTPGGQANF